MDNNENLLTPEGRQKLIEELEWREGEKDAEIIQRIQEARDFGDLSENSEFDDAKDEQAKNADRIAQIRKILSTSKVSEGGKRRGTGVTVGDTVEVEDAKGKRSTYTIVGTTETNSLANRISNESPLGAALIGAKKGDEVSFVTPAGKKRTLTLVKVTH